MSTSVLPNASQEGARSRQAPPSDLLAPSHAGLSGREARARLLASAVGRKQGWLSRQLGQQSLRWPLFYPVGLMLGAGAYVWSPVEPERLWLGGLLALALLGVLLTVRRAGGLLAFLAVLAVCVGAGAMAGKVRAAFVAAPVLTREIGPVRLEGVVAEIDASNASRRIRIDVRAIEDVAPEQTPRFIRIAHKAEITVGPGRSVSCLAVLSPPPRPVAPGDYEFHRDAWFQQLGGVGFAIGACRPIPEMAPADAMQAAGRWIGALRRSIAEHVNELAGAGGGGMTAAMLVGDRSFLTADDSDALRDSGLAHLLSISGVHMVLAGGIFFFIIRILWPLCEPLALRVPTPRAAAFGAIVAVTLYFAISGGSVATQRAFVMALIGFGAKLFRPAISLRSVAIALGVVVLTQPESVATPGFQMSFAASAALIALYEVWPRLGRPSSGLGGGGLRVRVAGWALGTVSTSLAASAATMPFALHHFDRTAVMSILANVVAEPVIGLWTTPAAALAALAAPLGLEAPFLWLMGKSLEVVLWVAHQCAGIDPRLDAPRLPALGLALAAGALVVLCVLDGWARLLSLLPLAAAGWIWTQAPRTAAYIAGDGSAFVRAEANWVEVTDWRGHNGLDPMAVRDAKVKERCPGRQAACELAGRYGRWRIEPLPVVYLAPPDGASSEPSTSGVSSIGSLPPVLDVQPIAENEDGATISGRRLARVRRAPGAHKSKFDPCPAKAELVFTPAGGPDVRFDPCAIGVAGGAVIEVRDGRAKARFGESDAGRPWGQGGQ